MPNRFSRRDRFPSVGRQIWQASRSKQSEDQRETSLGSRLMAAECRWS
ncbi:hypothetical protein H6F67_16875 [Microcoleus sp. FACHB-1515]|nr:hypothetical protein [Microcoleus sp. FACHB-1515]MBD2091518.1 hypothetical protein [Microcoleus sp. FACHB-1515]